MPHRSPISPIIFSTVLPAMRTPCSARRRIATWRWPQPFGVRENISATASRSSGLVGFSGWASA